MQSRSRILFAFVALLLGALAAPAAQVNLTFGDASNNETGFTLERAPGLNATTGFSVLANIPSTGAAVAGVGPRTYTDTTAAAATAYSYRIRAYNAAGPSAWSNTANFTTSSPPPSTPGTLEATPPPDYVPPAPTITLLAGESLTVVASAAPLLEPEQ